MANELRKGVLAEIVEVLLDALLFFPMIALLSMVAYGFLLREMFGFWANGRPPH